MKIYAKENLSITRIKAGFTLEMVGQAAGMTRQGVSQVERGKNGIMADKAAIICNLLGVGFDDVFIIKK